MSFLEENMMLIFQTIFMATLVAIIREYFGGTMFKSTTSIFHHSLDIQNLNVAKAESIVSKLTQSELSKKVAGKIPLLHHILHLIASVTDFSERKRLVKLASTVVSTGGNVNTLFSNREILSESLKLKEISLAISVAKRGAVLHSSESLIHLYSLPCSVIYLAGMLLKGHELMRQSNVDTDSLSAVLETNEDLNVISHSDLYLTSPTYQKLINKIGSIRIPIEVSFVDLQRSLSEVASTVHYEILQTEFSVMMKFMDHLSALDDFGRNPLHWLAVSGGSDMMDQLHQFFSNADVSVHGRLGDSLASRDCFGHTPMSYANSRFPDSPISASMAKLARMCFISSDFLEALSAQEASQSPIEVLDASRVAILQKNAVLTSSNSGGWAEPRIPYSLVPVGSNSDVVEVWTGLPSREEFLLRYVSNGRPVVFRGAALDLPIRSAFAKEQFLSNHGDETVVVASIPYASHFGQRERQVSMAQLANEHCECKGEGEGELLYAFTSLRNHAISSDAPPPPFLSPPISVRATQFYLGGAGTGAPPHFHGSAVNVLAYGEKVSRYPFYAYRISASLIAMTAELVFVPAFGRVL